MWKCRFVRRCKNKKKKKWSTLFFFCYCLYDNKCIFFKQNRLLLNFFQKNFKNFFFESLSIFFFIALTHSQAVFSLCFCACWSMSRHASIFELIGVICLGGLLFGYAIGSIAGALESVQIEFSLDSLQLGAISACFLFGAMIGSIAGAPVCEKLGLKKVGCCTQHTRLKTNDFSIHCLHFEKKKTKKSSTPL